MNLIDFILFTAYAYLNLFTNRLDPNGNSVRSKPSPYKKSALDLILEYGYHGQAHEVQTEDGYLLTLHRIPHGIRDGSVKNRPVVLLHHGLMASSDPWLLRGPDKDLAYILADSGYDVWMSNCRGSFYSRKHITLNPDRDKQFWKYSLHEIGIYDLPATIDYILNLTKQKDLFYMGHSMGGGVFFILTSMKPEYNYKIRLMVGLAPAAYITHRQRDITQSLIDYFLENGNAIVHYLQSGGYYEFFPLKAIHGQLGQTLCSIKSSTQPMCIEAIFYISGPDYELLNRTLIETFFNYFPAGTSIYQLIHYLQGIILDDFRQLDYGTKINLIKYNQTQSPAYDMNKVTAPAALYSGQQDITITEEDTVKLGQKLPNLVGVFSVPYFNHVDFLLANDAKSILYDHILDIMKRY